MWLAPVSIITNSATETQMAIRKRGFRRIVVDGVAYRWKVPHRLTQNQEDAWPGVWAAVQRIEPEGALLWVVFPLRYSLSGPLAEKGRPILPSEIAAGIRAALVAGWQADRLGKQFCYQMVEAGPVVARSPDRATDADRRSP
jgi:hypothetical protein